MALCTVHVNAEVRQIEPFHPCGLRHVGDFAGVRAEFYQSWM